MRIERTKNTINGFIWGATGKIVNTLLPFLIRTVMIYKLGVEYLGLSSLFASILQVLSLTELGFSYACVFAMYKPIAEDDYETVGAILWYLKKIYTIIGICILSAGLLLVPFLDVLINGDVPTDINIYILYLIYLLNSALSYFCFAYKSSLLSALQCNDVIHKAGLLTNTLLRISQGVGLLVLPNYYVYVLLIPIMTLLNNVIKAYVVDHRFPQYLVKGEIQETIKADIKKKITPLIGIKISTVLINAADTLVISAFLGLTEAALYNNYFFVMSSVQSIVNEIHSSMLAGVGNSLVVDDRDSVVKKFEMLHFINTWLVIFCTVCFACLFQPFMSIWIGPELMLPNGMVVMFCAYFFATTVQRIVIVYKDAAGIWKEDMARCYIACILNVVLNIVSVRHLGLYGVIGSSVLVGFLIDPWMARTLHRVLFKKSSKEFYLGYIRDVVLCCVLCLVFSLMCWNLEYSWVGIFARIIICCVGVNAALALLYRKNRQFERAKTWLLNVLQSFFDIKDKKRLVRNAGGHDEGLGIYERK